jgi:hypothetical protein
MMLWEGGAFSRRRRPLFEDGMFKPLPPTGARTLDSRTAFYYGYTLDSPGMIMRIPGVGSQYLLASSTPRRPLRRREDLQGDAAQGHPRQGVLVVHALRQPDALDAADAAEIPARRLPELPLAGGRGGRGRLHHGLVLPEQPDGVARGNWIQTDPDKGWFTGLRLYSPLPAFFDKSWRPTEIALQP